MISLMHTGDFPAGKNYPAFFGMVWYFHIRGVPHIVCVHLMKVDVINMSFELPFLYFKTQTGETKLIRIATLESCQEIRRQPLKVEEHISPIEHKIIRGLISTLTPDHPPRFFLVEDEPGEDLVSWQSDSKYKRHVCLTTIEEEKINLENISLHSFYLFQRIWIKVDVLNRISTTAGNETGNEVDEDHPLFLLLLIGIS